MRISGPLCALILLISGCSTPPKADGDKPATPPASAKKKPSKPLPPANPREINPADPLNGRIATVNSALRFVVIDFPPGKLPEQGQHLFIYRHGIKVGEVKINGPSRDTNIAADIISGDAAPDDTARPD